MTATTPRRFGILAHIGNGNLGDEATVAVLLQNIRARHRHAEVLVISANPADTHARHGVPAIPITRGAAGRTPHGEPAPPTPEAGPTRAARAPEPSGRRLRGHLRRLPWLYAGLRALNAGLRAASDVALEVPFLIASLRALRGVDRLIIAGGGQLGDYFGGPWGYPFRTFNWCVLARLAGARVVFASVGAEPITSAVSKRFLRWALALADYRSFRDAGSRRLLQAIAPALDCRICPDLVHGFALTPPEHGFDHPQTGLVVGINPIPYFDRRYWAEADTQRYGRYCEVLSALALWLIDHGHTVLFFPTQVRADPPVVADIRATMQTMAGTVLSDQVLHPPVLTFADLARVLTTTDIVVTSRFHGIVFSYLFDRPALGMSYYRKMEELMQDMGQGAYGLAIPDADLETLKDRFLQLEKTLAQAKEQIARRREEYRTLLDAQYDTILGDTETLRRG